jgi:hypothetical protein
MHMRIIRNSAQTHARLDRQNVGDVFVSVMTNIVYMRIDTGGRPHGFTLDVESVAVVNLETGKTTLLKGDTEVVSFPDATLALGEPSQKPK